eukprot:TRINITY_DN6473_c0_g1_i8.p1 TRINITY_DN6473_c0_g1~~TRINITY_DN6473_c0_g1_i8.p1  ORF type:complete len:221 (-),score=5.60 TRINITY_DN6473_c0_g1_i8:19-642(-)
MGEDMRLSRRSSNGAIFEQAKQSLLSDLTRESTAESTLKQIRRFHGLPMRRIKCESHDRTFWCVIPFHLALDLFGVKRALNETVMKHQRSINACFQRECRFRVAWSLMFKSVLAQLRRLQRIYPWTDGVEAVEPLLFFLKLSASGLSFFVAVTSIGIVIFRGISTQVFVCRKVVLCGACTLVSRCSQRPRPRRFGFACRCLDNLPPA